MGEEVAEPESKIHDQSVVKWREGGTQWQDYEDDHQERYGYGVYGKASFDNTKIDNEFRDGSWPGKDVVESGADVEMSSWWDYEHSTGPWSSVSSRSESWHDSGGWQNGYSEHLTCNDDSRAVHGNPPASSAIVPVGHVVSASEPACLTSFTADDKSALLSFFRDTVGRRDSTEYKDLISEMGDKWTLQPSHIKELEEFIDVEVMRGAAPTKGVERAQNHRARYMRFLRGAKNPKRVGEKSAEKFSSDNPQERVELFQSWIEAGEDWGRCEMIEERLLEAMNEKEVQHQWLNNMELMVLYQNDENLVNQIKTAAKGAKRWRKHDLVDDPKLDEYKVRVSSKEFDRAKRGSRKVLTLNTGDLSKDEVGALVNGSPGDGDDGHGAFSADGLLALENGTPTKTEGTVVAKLEEPTPPPKAPKAKPDAKPPPELCTVENMQDCLAEATDFANSLCVLLGKSSSMVTKLQALGVGSDVVGKIGVASQGVEKNYSAIKKLTKAEVHDRVRYKPHVDWVMMGYNAQRFLAGVAPRPAKPSTFRPSPSHLYWGGR